VAAITRLLQGASKEATGQCLSIDPPLGAQTLCFDFVESVNRKRLSTGVHECCVWKVARVWRCSSPVLVCCCFLFFSLEKWICARNPMTLIVPKGLRMPVSQPFLSKECSFPFFLRSRLLSPSFGACPTTQRPSWVVARLLRSTLTLFLIRHALHHHAFALAMATDAHPSFAATSQVPRHRRPRRDLWDTLDTLIHPVRPLLSFVQRLSDAPRMEEELSQSAALPRSCRSYGLQQFLPAGATLGTSSCASFLQLHAG
jgi:hypothetical protein